jgi:hypothetical protein
MLLTPSEWARQKGFSRQYANELIHKGIVRLVNGQIDAIEADAAVEAIREPARATRRSEEDGGSLSTLLLKSRIKTEVERGKLLEIRARAESGKLIAADEVKIAAFRRARIVRDGMLNLPDRLAAILAAEHDATKVHTLLTTEIRTVLVELSDADNG